MKQKQVTLLFGGESSEHEVSLASARNVYKAIDREKYNVLLVYIDKQGRWWLVDAVDGVLGKSHSTSLSPLLGEGVFVTNLNDRVAPDVLLPILHGKNGEDGSVQGLAQLTHVPIVGCDVTASALCMDKLATKEVLMTHGIAIVPYAVHRKNDPSASFLQLQEVLGDTLFVKPVRSGSSVGVSKVCSQEELVAALELAHQHDETVLIEKAITARELEVAVLGTPPEHKVSAVGEIISDADFYTYEDKYKDGTSQSKIPADINVNTSHEIKKMASDIYTALGCSGLARVDFFLADTGEIYLNEVNTLPGFTDISMYPKLWQHEGISYPALIEMLISDALK